MTKQSLFQEFKAGTLSENQWKQAKEAKSHDHINWYRKAFDQIQQASMIRTQKKGTEEELLQFDIE